MLNIFKLIQITILCFLVINIQSEILDISTNSSIFYQEKFFRLLSNNYDKIEEDNKWNIFKDESGIGFKAKIDFGYILFLKDWCMYSFKLKKIIFKPICSYKIDGMSFDAELQLIHTLDNGYFPPGRRVKLNQNYLVISIPFKKTSNLNPSNDQIFHFTNMRQLVSSTTNIDSQTVLNVSPIKSIKLHQMIQHQPSFLFESNIPVSGESSLFMIFSQFHYISEDDYSNMLTIFKNLNIDIQTNVDKFILNSNDTNIYYRNIDNKDEVIPKATLLAYNNGYHYNFYIYLIFVIIIFLI